MQNFEPVTRGNFGLAFDQFSDKQVITLNPDASITEAAKLMLDNHVGDVVVTENRDGRHFPLGIITDRDIVIECVAKKLNPSTVKVSEIMSKDLVTANVGDDLSDLVSTMSGQGINRLPIVDTDGNLRGILSSKKLAQFFIQSLSDLSALTAEQQKREQKTH